MGLEFRLAAAQQHILMIVVEGGATLRVVKRLSRSILRGGPPVIASRDRELISTTAQHPKEHQKQVDEI